MSIANTSHYRRALWLVIFLFSLLGTALAQEIPNGDGDLLWKIGNVAEGNGVETIAIHPINSNILIGSLNNIFEYDVQNGNLLRKITIDSAEHIKQLFVSSDGTQIIIKYEIFGGTNLQVFEYLTGNYIRNFGTYISTICMYPNNQDVLGQLPSKIVRYNYKTNEIINSIEWKKFIDAITLSPDGTKFAVATIVNNKSIVTIYDANTFELIQELPQRWDGFIDLLEITSNNNYLCVSSLKSSFADIVKMSNNSLRAYKPKIYVTMSADESIIIAFGFWFNQGIDCYKTLTNELKYHFNNNGIVKILNDNRLLVARDSLFLYTNNWSIVGVDNSVLAYQGYKRLSIQTAFCK